MALSIDTIYLEQDKLDTTQSIFNLVKKSWFMFQDFWGYLAGFIQSILTSDGLSVPIQSADGPMTLRFVEKHFLDLKRALPNCTVETPS